MLRNGHVVEVAVAEACGVIANQLPIAPQLGVVLATAIAHLVLAHCASGQKGGGTGKGVMLLPSSAQPLRASREFVALPADPPGQIGGTGHYNSPRGCTGDFVTTRNTAINTIDATFDGIDCDDGSAVRLTFSGRIRVTK